MSGAKIDDTKMSEPKVFYGKHTGLKIICRVKNGTWDEFYESLKKKFAVIDLDVFSSLLDSTESNQVKEGA